MTGPARPAPACEYCWRHWRAQPAPLAIGYCPHAALAWRIRPSGEVTTIACTRAEYRTLLREQVEGGVRRWELETGNRRASRTFPVSTNDFPNRRSDRTWLE
jgi:hypothetical protein